MVENIFLELLEQKRVKFYLNLLTKLQLTKIFFEKLKVLSLILKNMKKHLDLLEVKNF